MAIENKPKSRDSLLFVIVVLFWFAQFIYMPFFSPYLTLIGIPASIVGIIAGSYGFTQMILRIPLSIGGSIRGNHKAIMGWGLVAVIFSCAIPLFSDSWVVFLLTRALAGVASSTWVSYSAYLLEGAGASANQQMGRLLAANTGGIFIAQLTGTIVYDHVGIKTLFIIAVCAASAGLLLLAFRFPARHYGADGGIRPVFTRRSFLSVLRNKNLWACSILMSLAHWVGFSSNVTFTGVYAQKALGAGALHLGLISLVYQAASVIMSMVFGRIGKKRIPEKGIVSAAFAGLALCCAITVSCSLAGLISLQFAMGICMAVVSVILFARAGSDLADEQQLLSMGIFQSIYSIGMTAGPAVSGVLFESSGGGRLGFSFVFYSVAAVSLAGAIVASAGLRKKS